MRMEMKEQLFWRRKYSGVAMVREVDRDEGENFKSRDGAGRGRENRSGETKTESRSRESMGVVEPEKDNHFYIYQSFQK